MLVQSPGMKQEEPKDWRSEGPGMLVQSPGMKQEEPKDWRSEGPGSFKPDQSSRNVLEAEARTLMVIRAKRK
jgi:hypothetical protein